MDRDEAVAAIASGDSHERLRAARFWMREATANDERLLREALAREDVRWIKAALRDAIARLSPESAPAVVAPVGPEADGGVARGTEMTTRMLLHELEPLLGSLRLAAAAEVPDFNRSRTRRQLAKMDKFLDAILGLARAAAEPRFVSSDLGALVNETVTDVSMSHPHATSSIRLAGVRPVPIKTDPALVTLALRNGLVNALEANEAAEAREPVVVSWGSDKQQAWISILDGGGGPTTLVAEGTTRPSSTKPGHSGMGLTIARRAITSLGGTLSLRERSDAQGGRFEIRLPMAAESPREGFVR